MTQEEKARAYDEALTTAKRIISENCSEIEKLCLKCVFSELAESEDERIRKEILNYVLYKADGVSEEDEHRWVTWLEKQKEPENVSASTMIPSCWEVEQKEQNPAWSEEDRKMLDDCIMALSNWRDAVANYGHEVVPCQKLIDWLKSLRPSWRPSEEQMDSLERTIILLEKQGHFVEVDMLKSIQRNLKKL